ncbi:MAG TPA: oligopeptide/dipeptide ABC transporter ATP-binding protein, partial [bacterium]|nr:oligopeptide/dipeptide ABC transporter ATP-binding protein [bacterium]
VRRTAKGEPPDPARIPSGCAFHPRCAYAKEICEREEPPLVTIGATRAASCHFARDLSLEGAT